MKKKIILIMVLSFSLLMFGCSSNKEITEQSVNMIENSMFTIYNNESKIKILEKSGYRFSLRKSSTVDELFISRLNDESSMTTVYKDGRYVKSRGWTEQASEEDKQTIKNILRID